MTDRGVAAQHEDHDMTIPDECRRLRREVENLAEDIFRAAAGSTNLAALRETAKQLRAAQRTIIGKRPLGRPNRKNRDDDDDDDIARALAE